MHIKIRLFAVARELAGAPEIEIDLPAGATVADLRAALFHQFPQLSSFGSGLRFSVNAQYAGDNTPLSCAAEIACIPPTSGG